MRSSRLRIAVDILGSDSSPQVLFEGVVQVAKLLNHSHILIVLATQAVADPIQKLYASFLNQTSHAQIIFQIVQEEILMSDDPLSAVRHKKHSSLVTGIKLLKKKQIDAFVSTGNTGALLASASLSLPHLRGIRRPALLACLPTRKKAIVVIDVGGNVYCKAQQLVQFARLGVAYQIYLGLVKLPRVGLLNIGIESKKGTNEVREAYQILKQTCEETVSKGEAPPMLFAGNVEAREIFEGNIDVLVTDGFTGNVLLKTIEGFSGLIFNALEVYLEEKSSSLLTDFNKTFDYKAYPGAVLCGVDGIIVKCHGNSSAQGFASGIQEAVQLIHKEFIQKIKQQLA